MFKYIYINRIYIFKYFLFKKMDPLEKQEKQIAHN